MRYLDTILIFLIIIFSFSLGVLLKDNVTGLSHKNINELSGINNSQECFNLSLDDTAYCLRDYVQTFYKYVVREDTDKTLEDLKQNGGDCHDWALLYAKMGKELGFNTDTFPFYTEDEGHRFAIIWDINMSRYCILDNLDVHCLKLTTKQENQTENTVRIEMVIK